MNYIFTISIFSSVSMSIFLNCCNNHWETFCVIVIKCDIFFNLYFCEVKEIASDLSFILNNLSKIHIKTNLYEGVFSKKINNRICYRIFFSLKFLISMRGVENVDFFFKILLLMRKNWIFVKKKNYLRKQKNQKIECRIAERTMKSK